MFDRLLLLLVVCFVGVIACDVERHNQPALQTPSLEIPRLTPLDDAGSPQGASSPSKTGALTVASTQAPRITIHFGKPQSTGKSYASLDAAERVAKDNEPKFRACYETALKKEPSLHGTVEVLLLIGVTGDVETVIDHGSTIADPSLIGCARRVFFALDFPRPTNGSVMVDFPIDFAQAPP